MKILIYGGNGWIGEQVISLLNENRIFYVIGKEKYDSKKFEEEIDFISPTHVISLIGITHGEGYSTIDYLEQDGKLRENIRDNLFSPLSLGLICCKRNIHFTYMGTGCIFKYDNDHTISNGFKEEDDPNFFGSSYSTVKGFTDQLFDYLPNTLNLRIRMPITNINHPRNFITKIVNYEKICSISNSMSVLPELLPIMIDMMEKKMTGKFNFTNPGVISHNEILSMYKLYVDKDFKWQNFSAEEQRQILLADRSNNYLSTKKLEELYPNILDIKSSVRKIMMHYR